MSESTYWTDRLEREREKRDPPQKFELWLDGRLVWTQMVDAGNSFVASASDGSWSVKLAP